MKLNPTSYDVDVPMKQTLVTAWRQWLVRRSQRAAQPSIARKTLFNMGGTVAIAVMVSAAVNYFHAMSNLEA